MTIKQPSPHFAVDKALKEILDTQEVPRTGAANLFFAGTSFADEGDTVRAQICGQASVAVLRLENAIRDEDGRQLRAVLELIMGLHDHWHRLEPEAIAHHPASMAAA